jgi:hypothetical protein
MFKNIFKRLFFLALVFFVFNSGAFLIQAAEMDGHAWSSTIGWIKMKGTNYGVTVDDSTGNLSGYAWSSNIGWVDFNPSGPYPASPNHSAKIEGDRITGWARVCSVFASDCTGASASNLGGFTGWIHFPAAGSGVVLSGNNFTGYAWGGGGNTKDSAVLGWVDFQRVTTDYGGIYNPNLEYLKVDDTGVNYCNYPDNPPIRVVWKYNSFDPAYDQKAFEVEIRSGGTAIYNSGEVSGSGGSGEISYLAVSDQIQYGGSYTVHLRIQNNDDPPQWSEWMVADFQPDVTIPPAYHYPKVNFTNDPLKPEIDEEVSFDGSSSVSGDAVRNFSWTFSEPRQVIGSLTSATVKVIFNSAGENKALLRVTDNRGFYCEKEEDLRIKYPLPDWREITPFGKIYNFMGSVFSFFTKKYNG